MSLIIGLVLSGCVAGTRGNGDFGAFFGMRSEQISEEPFEVTLRSQPLESFVESITDNKLTDAELDLIIKLAMFAATLYIN